MWTCDKYKVSMLAANADALCARRFAAAISGKPLNFDVSKCESCNRGAIQYELGKHEGGGDVTTKRTYKEKPCATCRNPFTPAGPRQDECTECRPSKKSKGGKKAVMKKPRAVAGTTHIQKSAVVPHRNAGKNELTVSIDLTKYPKLHGRLISLALNQVLEEMEAKA